MKEIKELLTTIAVQLGVVIALLTVMCLHSCMPFGDSDKLEDIRDYTRYIHEDLQRR